MFCVRLVHVNFNWQHNFNVLVLCIIGWHVSKQIFSSSIILLRQRELGKASSRIILYALVVCMNYKIT